MWISEEFRVGDRMVTASIRMLESDERQVVATSIAWLAASSTRSSDPNATVWKTLIEEVLGPHLRLVVDHDQPECLDRAWWNETIRRAMAAFVRANALESLIAGSPRTWPNGGARPTIQ